MHDATKPIAMWILVAPSARRLFVVHWLRPLAIAEGARWEDYLPTEEQVRALETSLHGKALQWAAGMGKGAIRVVEQTVRAPIHVRPFFAHCLVNLTGCVKIACDFLVPTHLHSYLAVYTAFASEFDQSGESTTQKGIKVGSNIPYFFVMDCHFTSFPLFFLVFLLFHMQFHWPLLLPLGVTAQPLPPPSSQTERELWSTYGDFPSVPSSRTWQPYRYTYLVA
jgi:hypothetical protein